MKSRTGLALVVAGTLTAIMAVKTVNNSFNKYNGLQEVVQVRACPTCSHPGYTTNKEGLAELNKKQGKMIVGTMIGLIGAVVAGSGLSGLYSNFYNRKPENYA